jgi:hypothetical protein
MTDEELRRSFGIPQRALRELKKARGFPAKGPLLGKTDSRAVDFFFDLRSGVQTGSTVPDGPENFK